MINSALSRCLKHHPGKQAESLAFSSLAALCKQDVEVLAQAGLCCHNWNPNRGPLTLREVCWPTIQPVECVLKSHGFNCVVHPIRVPKFSSCRMLPVSYCNCIYILLFGLPVGFFPFFKSLS